MNIICITLVLFLIIINNVASSPSRVLSIACERNASLPYCVNNDNQLIEDNNNHATTTIPSSSSSSDGIIDDEAAKTTAICLSLQSEYTQICDKPSNDDEQFCQVYISTCGDRLSVSSVTQQQSTEIKINYQKYCVKNKDRYLTICSDPLRFDDDRAIVFCPEYNERCGPISLQQSIAPVGRRAKNAASGPYADAIQSTIKRLCKRYRQFAANYCYHPATLSIARYRSQCAMFFRFCK